MSRRSQLVKAVRKNTTKKTSLPFIIISDAHDGGPLIVNWALSHRDPTPAEIEAAIAKWKREQDTFVEPPILKPVQGSGEEEEIEV